MPRVSKTKQSSTKSTSFKAQLQRASYKMGREAASRKFTAGKKGRRRLTKKQAQARVRRGHGFGTVKYAKSQRAKKMAQLKQQIRIKSIQRSLKNLRKKVNKTDIPPNVVVYRDYTGVEPLLEGNPVFQRREGQLVLKGNVPAGIGEVFTGTKNGKPVYHMDSWTGTVEPGVVSIPEQREGIEDLGEQFMPSFPNGGRFPVPIVQRFDDAELQALTRNLASAPRPYNTYGPKPDGTIGLVLGKSMKMDGFAAYEHLNIVPAIFHQDCIDWGEAMDVWRIANQANSNAINDTFELHSQRMQQLFDLVPRRKGDTVKVVNNYLKFDFVNLPTAYMGQFEVADEPTIHSMPKLQDVTNPNNDVGGVTFNRQRVPLFNNYVQARVIIGYRTKDFIKQDYTERIRLRDLFQDEASADDYMIHRTNEEFINDHFNRKIALKDKDGVYNLAATDEPDNRPTIQDTTIMVDEKIKLGLGHTVKTYNLMKGHTLKYQASENAVQARPNQQWDGPQVHELLNQAGVHPETYGTYSQITSAQTQAARQSRHWMAQTRQQCHATNRQYFCFVIMRTRGQRASYRISQKFEFSP